MTAPPAVSDRLARALVLDELFDLSLYRALRERTSGSLRQVFEELIPIETRHFAFWQEFFGIRVERLDWRRRLKLRLLVGACRLIGARAVDLTLEAIEIYGVRKYLTLWELYKDDHLGRAVKDILEDELRHEDRIVSETIERRIDPATVRNFFFGFNDGLVEILGAVSGFFAAFQDAASILVASSTVAVAGAFSMGAGAYVATSSESEIERLERRKRAFLGSHDGGAGGPPPPLRSAVLVAVAYLLGATVPVLPVLLGAQGILASLVAGGVLTVLLSAGLAFLSGMKLRRRIATNVAILGAAVAITYTIGLAARALWGIEVG